ACAGGPEMRRRRRRQKGSVRIMVQRSVNRCASDVQGTPVVLIGQRSLWYAEFSPKSGNNSVVECDLAKVEVAGSNPVSRSNLRSRRPSIARATVGKPERSR